MTGFIENETICIVRQVGSLPRKCTIPRPGKHPHDRIPISSLVRVTRCPVRFAYERDQPYAEPPRYTICRQVASWLSGMPSVENCFFPTTGSDAGRFPESVWKEICEILRPGPVPRGAVPLPGCDPAMTDPQVYRRFFEECVVAWKGRAFPQATDEDLPIWSERFGIAGSVDIYDSGTGEFTIIRAASPPAYGVWASDRLRITACIAALSECYPGHAQPHQGTVAYIPCGVIRPHAPTARDRRALFRAIRSVEDLLKGNAPKKPVSPPCNNCPWKEKCEHQVGRRLSDLL